MGSLHRRDIIVTPMKRVHQRAILILFFSLEILLGLMNVLNIYDFYFRFPASTVFFKLFFHFSNRLYSVPQGKKVKELMPELPELNIGYKEGDET